MASNALRHPGDVGTTGPHLPRFQAGTSSQHLLTTLLGDYWCPRPEHLPSAALIDLLGEFDIGPAAARAALNRLARRGVLTSSKCGRNSYYGFAEGAVDMLLAGAYRFLSFGRGDQDWDGRWTIALFSLNERERDLRHAVRSRLRWLGFAPLYDATWVSTRDVGDQALRELADLGIRDVTVFRAAELPGSLRHPISAWDLGTVESTYADFIATYAPLRARIRDGDVSAGEALLVRTRIMDGWRTFPAIDPDLPAALLPRRWPRREAREVFVEVYDSLGPLAAIRVRQIVARHAAELARRIDHHTTDRLLDLGRQALERTEKRRGAAAR